MKLFKRRIWAGLLVGVGVLLAADVSATGYQAVSSTNIPDARLVRDPDGSFSYLLPNGSGSSKALTPEEFAERSYYGDGRSMAVSADRPPLYKVLNITTPSGIAWVILGLFGQLLYTTRMALQWIVSERHRQSIVPVAFWWLSLVAACSVMAYFIWRRDIVGILGNSIGCMVYVRNLCLIANEKKL